MKTILIADDNEDIVEAIRLILETEEFQVEVTTKGNVMEKISRSQPDLLLLDIWMSGMDGRDICKTIKHTASLKNLRIIFISAIHDIQKSTRDAGADDFLAKPFGMEELLGKVRKHLATSPTVH